MADRPTHTVSAKTGRVNAENKPVYVIVGSAWSNDRGMVVKIDQLPVRFDGSLYINERRDERP